MNWKQILTSFVAALVGGLVVLLLYHPGTQVMKLGAEGDSNFTNVVTSGNLSVTGSATLGSILQTATGSTNLFLGMNILGNVVQAANGFSMTITTSTSLTAAQLCAATTIRVLGTVANATITMPSATSTWVACGSPSAGSWSEQIIVNDSTNTISLVAGNGVRFKFASGTALLGASSTWIASGIFNTTSTMLQLYDVFN